MPSANSTSATPTVAKRSKSSTSTAKVSTRKTDGLAHSAQATAALLAESRAHCGQCGRELRHVPFLLKNIMCRDCYGLDRYRRTAPSSWKPEQQREVLLSDQKSAGAK